MSDPGRTEAAKRQPKKYRRAEGDVSFKAVVGNSPQFKKGKKKTEVAQEEQPVSEQKKPAESEEVVKVTEETKEAAVSNSQDAEVVSPPSPKPPVKEQAAEKLPEENGDSGKIEEIKEEKPESVEEISEVEKIRVSSPAKTVPSKVILTAVTSLLGASKVCLVRLSADMSVKLAIDEYGVPLIVYNKHKYYRGAYSADCRTHEYKCVQHLCLAKIYLSQKGFKVVKEVNRHDHEAPPESEAQSNIKKECLYKILVIGELGTGKTSIIKRYVHQFFSQHYRATIGVDFALKVLNWDQNTIIRLQLWDIAGQERFGNMTRVYYKEAVGAFIVFDVTRAATFDAVVKWKQDLDAKVQLADGSPIPCVLLANKCDQQKEGLVNNPNKMNEYCEEHKFSAWFETSAKENINIEEAAKSLVDLIVRNDSSNENGRDGFRDTSKFPLESTEEFSDGKSCAC